MASGFCGESLMWWLEDGTLTIRGTGDMDNYVYDSDSDSANTPWWDYRNEIKRIIIHDGVTTIGDLAFCLCKSLTEIKIPDNITYIGEGTFSFCYNLTEIKIPDGVTSIGEGAFRGCNSLEKIYCKRGTSFESNLRYLNNAEIVYYNDKPAAQIQSPIPAQVKPSTPKLARKPKPSSSARTWSF